MKNQHRNEKPTVRHASIPIGNDDDMIGDDLAAIKQFVEQVGGIENARWAIAALKELKKGGVTAALQGRWRPSLMKLLGPRD